MGAITLTKFNIDNVMVSNCSGTLTLAAFWIGDGSSSNPNSVTSLTVSDCILTAPAVLDLTAEFRERRPADVVLVPSDSAQRSGARFARSAPVYGKMTYVGSILHPRPLHNLAKWQHGWRCPDSRKQLQEMLNLEFDRFRCRRAATAAD